MAEFASNDLHKAPWDQVTKETSTAWAVHTAVAGLAFVVRSLLLVEAMWPDMDVSEKAWSCIPLHRCQKAPLG